jgi:hypothetical protein
MSHFESPEFIERAQRHEDGQEPDSREHIRRMYAKKEQYAAHCREHDPYPHYDPEKHDLNK